MGFILHWLEQVRHWESLVREEDQLTANWKKTLLENAVNGQPGLKTVKKQPYQSVQRKCLLGSTGSETLRYDLSSLLSFFPV